MNKKQTKEQQELNFLKNELKIKNAGFIEVSKSSKKRTYICQKCNTIFSIKRKNLVKNLFCRNCMSGASFGEQVVINILVKNNIPFEKEKTFKNLNGENGGKLRFDFYIKKQDGEKFIIEIDGEQHFSQLEWDQNTKNHDIIKNDFCLKNNIKLYRVKYIFGKLKNISESVLSILKKEGYNVHCEQNNNDYLVIQNKKQSFEIKDKKPKSKSSKKNYYAIKRGRQNNKIVRTWKECKKLVNKYPSAQFKGFETKEEAEMYLKNSQNDNIVFSCGF